MQPGGSERSREAKTLDRSIEQAIVDYAPGTERIWDKRLLTPQGLVGPITHGYKNNWQSYAEPVGEATWQIFCRECRNLSIKNITIEKAKDKPDLEKCPICDHQTASAYLAVVPNGFMTDFDLSKPAGKGQSSGVTGTVSFVASPVIKDVVSFPNGGAFLAFANQQKVYRITQRKDLKSFTFKKQDSFRSPNSQWLNASMWVQDDNSEDVCASLAASKTTDLLSIRLLDRPGLSFFDNEKELSCRKAAWYSAATILQRAIALELDVDSMDIEIASVHKYTKDKDSEYGAELYLCDEHPNGAGLVDWAKKQWSGILSGCVDPDNNKEFSKLGRYIRNECERSLTKEQEWRSPDLLLKGFRNRHLHPLLDWRLGLELLAVMLDPEHIPGVTPYFEAWDLKLKSWSEESADCAENYCSSFGNGEFNLITNGSYLHGWVSEDDKTLNIVAHPLWEIDQQESDEVSKEIIAFAKKQSDVKNVRLLDSFNLSRRGSWVRNSPELFKSYDLSLFSHKVNKEKGDIEGLILKTEIKGTFNYADRVWERTVPLYAWTSERGVYIVEKAGAVPFEVSINSMPGRGQMIRTLNGVNLDKTQYLDLKVVARRKEELDEGEV
jgi:DEAD/DEAH box helicase domain-containing protein